MKIENLVPPLELCKLIPAGEFQDSAFCWHYTDVVGFVCRTSGCEQISDKQWQIVNNHRRKIEIRRNHGEEIYPAPTLQEIMAEIQFAQVSIFANGSFVIHPRFGGKRYMRYRDDNAATAALKLWLKMNGIEV